VRYLVIGGSGYIGSRLVASLAAREATERIAICDVRSPGPYRPKVSFEYLDVRDAARVRCVMERERPDVLVHHAFILNPVKDERFMYDVDVNGTHNVLDAAARTGVGQVLVTSSATAYGAFPDNPVPITEDHPVRGVPDFEYARDKTESDRLCQMWALQHPDRVMTIVRPCIVLGPNVDNYLSRFWTDQPFMADVAGSAESRVQFVHEDDVAEAIARLLDGRHTGAFNVAGDGALSFRETADLIGMPVRRMPERLARAMARATWRLGLSESPPGQLRFAQHPWLVSTDRLKETLGWGPRHSSRETFEIAMRAKGKLGGAPATAASAPDLAVSA